MASAASAPTLALVSMAMTWSCATETLRTAPAASAVTTKSPPTTGIPRWVRSYEKYCSALPPTVTPVRCSVSSRLLRRAAMLLATNASALAAAVMVSAGAGSGAAFAIVTDAVEVPTVAVTSSASAMTGVLRLT